VNPFDGSLYDYLPDTPVRCKREGCGWTGTFGELTDELRSFEFLSYECPTCCQGVVVVLPPTLAEIRAAAAAGHPDALKHLGRAEKAERTRQDYQATMLRSPDQLPELELAGRTRFTWDVETTDERSWAAERTTVIRTADGRLVVRERAPWEGYGRFIAVRRMLRARHGAGFGGLALTERALRWLSGDMRDVARQMGDPPVVADGHAGAGTSHEPVTLLDIGVRCERGARYEDPSVDLLADILRELGPGNAFLILDRLDGAPGNPFAQALADPDGSWVVEYRESEAHPIFHAETRDADLVRTVLVEWCLGLEGWRRRLEWAELNL
jgi:hypothetical protein